MFRRIFLITSSSELVQVRNAISQTSRGKNINEDWLDACTYLHLWLCHDTLALLHSNPGGLFQSAPLSIILLGSLMVTASSTNDFCLFVPLSTS